MAATSSIPSSYTTTALAAATAASSSSSSCSSSACGASAVASEGALRREPCPFIAARIAKFASNFEKSFRPGQPFPNVLLTGNRAVTIEELPACRYIFSTFENLRERNVVMFGTPAPYTKVCGTQHLKGFVEQAAVIKKLGYDLICFTSAGIDVARSWMIYQGDPHQIETYDDNQHEISDALGLGLNMTGERGMQQGVMRFAAIIQKGMFVWTATDKPAECTLTHATAVVAELERLKKSSTEA